MTTADAVLRKALVGSGLDTRGWTGVQAGLRDRAFFMAQVEDARILHGARTVCAGVAEGTMSQSEARRDLRSLLGKLGYDPGDGRGTIHDLLTRRRLDVMIETNAAQARGYVEYMRSTTAGALAAYPANELVRVKERRAPRAWAERWRAAAERVGWSGVARGTARMVALKTSPIWSAISRFGNPFPPFDFNSGMGTDDVSKRACVALGLVDENTPTQNPPKIGMNDSLQAEVPFHGNTPEYRRLQDSFGDQITHDGGRVVWRGNLVRDAFESGKPFEINLGKPTSTLKSMLDSDNLKMLRDKSFTADGKWLDAPRKSGVSHRDHFEPLERDDRNIPLTEYDLELIPSLWRSPERVRQGGYPGSLVSEIDTVDGGFVRMVIDITNMPRIKTFYKRKVGMG